MQRPAVDPMTSSIMLQNADHFEMLATEIQLQALKEDQYTGTQCLDVPLVIWRDMSLLDLTMEGNCEKFLEDCCASSLDDLFTGDISPYGDAWITLKMFMCTISLGLPLLFFPDLFEFNPPPRSRIVRTSSQV
jgi:hypothetical protein